jgi:hypothetical protein
MIFFMQLIKMRMVLPNMYLRLMVGEEEPISTSEMLSRSILSKNTNIYNLSFALFIGVNHHRHSIFLYDSS